MSDNRAKVIQAKSGRNTLMHDDIPFQLLDNAYNGLLKRILWPETGIPMTDMDRENVAGAVTFMLEIAAEVLEKGAIPAEIAEIIRRTVNDRLDIISTEITLNKADIPE